MTTLTALQTAMRLAVADRGRTDQMLTDVEYDDIAIALAAHKALGPASPSIDTPALARHLGNLIDEHVKALATRDWRPYETVLVDLIRHIDNSHRRLDEFDKIDSHRLIVAERRVEQLSKQLAAAPVATDDLRDARCWRYFLDNHPRQVAAALNCNDYEIDERMRDVVPGARP